MDAMIRPGWRTSRPTTPFTLLYINADGRPDEHTFESLSPRHRVGLGFRALLFFYRFLRNDILTQFTVRRMAAPREHAMKPGLGVPVILTRGLGTNAASRPMNSIGLSTT